MNSRDPLIDRTRVNSSCISSVGYSPVHEVLDIEFASGLVYRYFAVPPDAFATLLAAPSLGAHFNRAIKNRFDYDQLIEKEE